MSRTASGDLGPNRIVERPKVLFNDKTGKYVLWMHIDSSDYADAKVGVATGDSVCGKYSTSASLSECFAPGWSVRNGFRRVNLRLMVCFFCANRGCVFAVDYLRSFRPLGFQSRDMGLFKDDDGTGYLLTEDVSTFIHPPMPGASVFEDVSRSSSNYGLMCARYVEGERPPDQQAHGRLP